MPGDFRCDRGDYARVFVFITHEAAGALGTRHSLRPLFSEAQTIFATTRAHRAARSRSHILNLEYRHCEERSDEAIHLSLRGAMDCFASLAMTI
jgi:hypothetical protein